MLNKKLHLLIASIAFSGFALADDYAYPVVFIPVSDEGNGGHEEALGDPMSCKEARESAWFSRELSRTDGDTSPEVADVACVGEILARSNADYD